MAPLASSRRRTLVTWAPAVLVPSLVVAGVVVLPMSAGAVSLPERTPAEVLAMVDGAQELAYTATVTSQADLGLPAIDLGGAMPGGAAASGDAVDGDGDDAAAGAGAGDLLSTVLELAAGETTARVSLDPGTGVRVQVYDEMDERNIVVTESEAWFYDSATDEATRVPIPDAAALEAALPEGVFRDGLEAEARAKAESLEAEIPAELSARLSTPAGVAEVVIEALDAAATVTSADEVRVGGREAYSLLIEPDAGDSLVDSVTLAVDAQSGLPLQVVVAAVGQEAPAFSITVDELDLAAPDASVFAFTPPPSATITEVPEFDPAAARGERAERPEGEQPAYAAAGPELLQGGWASIVELPAPVRDATAPDGTATDEAATGEAATDEAAALAPLLDAIATPVDGGSVVRTALVTVFLVDDGRILAGTVPLSALQSAAAR